jgi:hypothetical protein
MAILTVVSLPWMALGVARAGDRQGPTPGRADQTTADDRD